MNKHIRIDQYFDTAFADEIATFESYNKHLYRPNTYLHKWWARRCGTTFRTILKYLVTDPTKQDFYTPGGLEGKIILDPMMGGGTTIHEAIRLGANIVGADIDPIPILQARATLSDIRLIDLQMAFHRFYTALHEQLGHLYQTTCSHCAQSYEWRFMLYAQRRQCDCQEMLFVDSFILRHNKDDSLIRIDPESYAIYQDDELIAQPSADVLRLPLAEKKTKNCDRCQQLYQENLQIPHYERYMPVAVVGECREHGLFFNTIGESEQSAIATANNQRVDLNFSAADFPIVAGPKSRILLDKKIDSYLDLFSSRQLLFLQKAIELLPDFEPLVRLNLALLVSTSLEFNSLLCGYKGATKSRPGAIRHTFAYHAYSFPYTVAENNPLYGETSSGNLMNLFQSRIVRGRRWAQLPKERRIVRGKARKVAIAGEMDMGTEVANFADLQTGNHRFLLMQGSSVALDLPDNGVDYVVTDPPYFDSVQYSDLAAFFRVWLRQLLPSDVDWHYALDEAAVDQQTNGNGQYNRILGDIFGECKRVLKDDGRLIFTFHDWDPKGWAALTKTLQRAGFVLVNRYVVHAENLSSVHITNQKSLRHDVILVLAPQESGIHNDWQLPHPVNLEESQAFCHDCGTAIGWFLNEMLPDDKIDKQWVDLLANKNGHVKS